MKNDTLCDHVHRKWQKSRRVHVNNVSSITSPGTLCVMLIIREYLLLMPPWSSVNTQGYSWKCEMEVACTSGITTQSTRRPLGHIFLCFTLLQFLWHFQIGLKFLFPILFMPIKILWQRREANKRILHFERSRWKHYIKKKKLFYYHSTLFFSNHFKK